MSLLTESFEPCRMIDKTTVADGYGGIKPAWVYGAQFEAAISIDQSIEARVAEKQDVKNLYTILVNDSVELDFHDVLQRVGDGKVFRVTSDGHDKTLPRMASMHLRKVTAEQFELTEAVIDG